METTTFEKIAESMAATLMNTVQANVDQGSFRMALQQFDREGIEETTVTVYAERLNHWDDEGSFCTEYLLDGTMAGYPICTGKWYPGTQQGLAWALADAMRTAATPLPER